MIRPKLTYITSVLNLTTMFQLYVWISVEQYQPRLVLSVNI